MIHGEVSEDGQVLVRWTAEPTDPPVVNGDGTQNYRLTWNDIATGTTYIRAFPFNPAEGPIELALSVFIYGINSWKKTRKYEREGRV